MKRKPSLRRKKPEPKLPAYGAVKTTQTDAAGKIAMSAVYPTAPSYQVPPLVLDEHQLREQLRTELKHEPDATDLRLRKLDLELQHFFARPGSDPDRNLRYLCALEFALTWADAAFAKHQPRPWDNDTYKGSLHAAINHALALETLKR